MKHLYLIYQDILHVYYTGAYDQLPSNLKKKLIPISLPQKIRLISEILIGPLIKYFQFVFEPKSFRYQREQYFKNKIWLYVGSKNNYDSIKFLAEYFENAVFLGAYQEKLKKEKWKNIYCAHRFVHLIKFVKLKKRIQARRKSKENYNYVLGKSLGYFENWVKILEIYQPRLIVFANDHRFDQRALLQAAKKIGIATVYIQHASISEKFPPLKFDLSLLEGEDTLRKYKRIGPIEGSVKLVGMPKFDPYFSKRNRNRVVRNIGISMSLVDDLERISKLVAQLNAAFPEMSIHFRPHPAERRNIDDIVKITKFSNSKQEGIFDYLGKIDFQIASASSVHLEATLLNIPSVFFVCSDQFKKDNYGYVENGLIPKYEDELTLMDYIGSIKDQKPDVYMRAKGYNAVLGTENEGQSKELVVKYINELLQKAD
ncbi:hypothetical protein [uncultured Draconibacterium sp.]|uniref:hypothetical protein n=1 Tax=uncultured Draconibacterium sp. TaxID=1573823 RepID=UPI0025EA1900|nr:hypothetical protein [uncultured Draconibacterium sp.]